MTLPEQALPRRRRRILDDEPGDEHRFDPRKNTQAHKTEGTCLSIKAFRFSSRCCRFWSAALLQPASWAQAWRAHCPRDRKPPWRPVSS